MGEIFALGITQLIHGIEVGMRTNLLILTAINHNGTFTFSFSVTGYGQTVCCLHGLVSFPALSILAVHCSK